MFLFVKIYSLGMEVTTTFLNFLYICLLESPMKITEKYMENLKQASGEIQARVRPQNFLGQSFALLLSFTIDILFRTTVLWK